MRFTPPDKLPYEPVANQLPICQPDGKDITSPVLSHSADQNPIPVIERWHHTMPVNMQKNTITICKLLQTSINYYLSRKGRLHSFLSWPTG